MRIGSTAVLARLLMPEQFGLIGMVTAFTGFAQVFKDLGLSDATIQQKDITHEKISTLFWINACVGFITMVVVACVSPAIAWFYGDTRLTGISVALSVCFLFGGISAQHHALLKRQMRFDLVTLINITSIFFGSVTGIILAFMGFDYWSLVWKEISTAFFSAVGTWVLCRWCPGLPHRDSGIRSMLRFGSEITGFNIANYFSKSIDRILVGRFNGAGSLGIYERALQLMILPINQVRIPLGNVAFSALSIIQKDPERYRDYYKKLNELLSFCYMPLVLYMGIFSENIIVLVLGMNWIDVVPIFRILAIAAFILPLYSIADVVLVSCGHTRKYLLWGMFNSVSWIIAFIIGVRWGAIGLATAFVAIVYILLVPSLWFRFQGTPVSVPLFFKSICLAASSSLFMGCLLMLMRNHIVIQSNILTLLFYFIVALILYFGIWWSFPACRKKLIEYYSYPKMLFK